MSGPTVVAERELATACARTIRQKGNGIGESWAAQACDLRLGGKDLQHLIVIVFGTRHAFVGIDNPTVFLAFVRAVGTVVALTNADRVVTEHGFVACADQCKQHVVGGC